MRFDHECQLSDRLSETKQTFSINSDLFENANNFGRNFFFDEQTKEFKTIEKPLIN